ncbi:glycosyl hydrolase family 28-related protein [Salimicrobium flavidum]|uniref:Pectate lyase superfamily protein n=1 Tax=Salimicrobium flavidum TaxID=570947 RepID=A0A1N7KMV0_9BACI|nr:glycosyl hydrolase family 28-related protein [Salimicrobium flavidum]SIS62949.1 Pectate lyase superfamily protein [Salimicrobium flavidum]
MKVGVVFLVILFLNGLSIYYLTGEETISREVTVEQFGADGKDEQDDSEAIQRAIDASSEERLGEVVLTGAYVLEKGIVLKEGVTLSFDSQSSLIVRGNFTVIEMQKDAFIRNALIMVEAKEFTQPVVFLDGKHQFWSWDRTGLDDVTIINTSGTNQGTGISLVADGSDEFISFVQFENVTIVGFETGIGMEASEPEGEEPSFVNGNRFINLILEDCVVCIDMKSHITVPNEVSGNQFSNLQVQLSDATRLGIRVSGSDNRIEGLIWDFEEYEDVVPAVVFSEKSQRNRLISNLTSSYIEDSGSTNDW